MLGERLGDYTIDRELGSGGMGKVYAATGPDGVVALKVVHPHLLETPGFFKRFMREAQLGQSIRHDNVVRTLECDQDFGGGKPQCFLVMEYVEGQTLAQLLNELERVPEELCRHVAREICKGLAAVHEAGVVHRDLKPENVLITPEHVVKIMDLGVAQVADEALRLSRDGGFVGSVEYAAPEQFKGGDVDGRTDLHALGVLLYELSSGQHPYRAAGFHAAMQKVCDAEPRRLGEVNPQLSAFFEEVVHTLLVKDPRGRFASATQLLRVLERGEASTWWHERARAMQARTKRPIRRIRIPRETAVHGREQELARLRGLYEKARAGDGQVVLLEGEAGIGKSRLVDELVALLQAEGEDLNFLFGSYPPGGAALATSGFAGAYSDQLGDAGSADYLLQAPSLVPAFDAWLRGEPAPSGAAPLTKDSLGTCFVHATRNLAAERTTVVLIDDLHFAPAEALAVFTMLTLAAPGQRLLLVGTLRPGLSEDWVAHQTRLPQTTRMDLARLGPKDLVALLRDAFQSEHLARTLGVQIAVKSDGNPFFAFEIVQGLREQQFIEQGPDGTWVTTRAIESLSIPSSVLDLVNARVAGLSQAERDVLDVAACCGYEFDPFVVGDVVGLARIPLLKLLSLTERKHRLVRSAGQRFVFDHHQVQEALYSGLPELLRESYHAALGEALEARSGARTKNPEELDGALCVDLAEHFLRGALGASALRYLKAAQAHLSERFRNARAAALGEMALGVPGLLAGRERVDTLLAVERSLDLLARRTRQEECAREAKRIAEASGDDEALGRATMALATLQERLSRYEAAEASFRRALEIARARGDRKAESEALGGLGNALRPVGRAAEARECMEASLALCRELGDAAGEVRETVNLGIVFHSQGHLAEARAHYEAALPLSRRIGARRAEANATGNLGSVLLLEGRLDDARELLERQLDLFRELGDRQGEAAANANLGNVFVTMGRLADARQAYARLLSICRDIGFRQGEGIGLGNLGVVLHLLGRVAEAEEHYELQLAVSAELGDREPTARALHCLGVAAREGGELDAAEERLRSCLEVCEEIGQRQLAAETQLVLGSLRAERERAAGGSGAAGRDALRAARDLSREAGVPGFETMARCELALLPGGDAADALAAHAENAERLGARERREARLLLWRATGDRTHLEAAKRLLDDALAQVPEEDREAMCRNLRVSREILAAWRDEVGDDEPRGTESATRVG